MAGRWLDIPGTRCAISDSGEVRGARGQLLSQNINAGGYPQVGIYYGQKRRTVSVHCLVAAAFLGPRPPGLDVNHLDGVKSNNAVSNLEYCTRSANTKHAIALGLHPGNAGDRNPRSKLPMSERPRVLEMLAAGFPRRALAQKYGVTPTRISQLKREARYVAA